MTRTLYLGTRKGLFCIGKDSGSWRIGPVHFLGEPVTMCLQDPRNGWLYATLTLGHFGVKLRRSTDGGQTWTECGVPAYPAGAMVPSMPGGGGPPEGKPATLAEIWSLEAGGPDQPGLLWAGTIPGGLFRSDNNGDTWELVESFWNRPERNEWFGGGKDQPGIHSICVDPRDSRHVTIGISCGGVWETRDAGETWQVLGQGLRAEFLPPELAYGLNQQDPHRLARCESDPDKMWIQHHNGIFRSTDGARNWEELTDVPLSTFGFAVCVHPNDGNRAWFVPGIKDERRVPVDAQLAVTRTKDGGKTFDVLRSGLPQEHCYDIVFRHALDIDASGECLAMGSSTGGLWLTEDGGDHWHCVSMSLPPIYCVRWER
ncbi:WD40/YVTN/BNR-like repeat-containing protein [Planctomicrobium piriforme]|uniref:BNR/Asp-box repeat-containing protein n=1 Tax=Planctomicrobium piriforme TaxID=1576369 RepID=A0A1I3G9Y8_9PLAN|nr:BNR/Asp-box repeat-containing protein [Planctomicrobium piriforme]